MPYRSEAQRGWAHTKAGIKALGGLSAIKEWDHTSKGMKLPYHAKSGGKIRSALRAARKYADGGATQENSDYDMDAAVAAGIQPDARGHWPDTYKRPNHMTFSDGSIYSTPATPGGHWENVQGDEWNFTPSTTNLQQHSVQELQDYFQKYEPKSHLILPQSGFADGGEVNDWDTVPTSPEGRPQITVTKPPVPTDLISKYARQAADWFSQPSQIKPETTPAPDFNAAPGQEIGTAVRSAGAGYLQNLKDLVDPFTKDEEGRYVADQPIPQTNGKIPAAQKDPISLGAPIAGEVLSTLAGPPGEGMVLPLIKGAVTGAMGAAAKTIGKSAARHGFLDTAHFKPVSLSKGTMPGGFKVDPATGAEWYVKQAPNLEQAKNEKLTAELYKLFGVPVADVHLTTVGGKPGIASRKIEGQQLSHVDTPYDQISGLHENYPIHALLANHDAVGTGPENQLGNIIVDKTGTAHVIDTGGGLTYKGTGSKKPEFTPEVPELDTMRDPQYSHLSAQVFGGVDHQAARVGAQRIANVSGADIAKLIEQYGPSNKMEKLNLLSTLLKRKHNIEQEFGVAPGESSAYTVPQAVKVEGHRQYAAQPTHDPYEQIPFTEEDYNNFGKDIPSPVPDDFVNPGPARPEPTKQPAFTTKISDAVAKKLMEGKKDKAVLSVAAMNLSKGSPWDAAHYLWEIADSVNPQTAEALFRALSPKIQVDVGHRIFALKSSLEYSPWNSIAKGSGKDGKYPSEYDFYTTQTNSFKPPASVLKDKKFMDDLYEYSNRLEGKEPALPQIAEAKGYEPIPHGFGNSWLNAPKEAHNLLEHFKTGPNGMAQDYDTKSIGQQLAKMFTEYPDYADKVYMKIPSHLKPEVLSAYGKAKIELERLQLAKDAETAAKGNINPIDGRIASFKKNNPIGIAFASQFLKPIENWQNWKPTLGHTKPFFSSVMQKNLAESRGFNTNFEIHKGGEFPNPSWEDEAYPHEIPDPSKKDTEPAWFGSDQAGIANQYGKHTGGTYIVGGKKIVEADWHKYTLEESWSPQPMHNLILAAKNHGADMVVIHGMNDMGGSNQTQYAVINPAILRAPKAKFDKSKLHKSFPLAGLAGGGLFTYGQISDEGKDKMNRGGIPALLHRAKKMASGGSADMSGGYHPRHPAGMIKSSIPGRTDKIPMSVPPGSYILPADIPSALGQNNTMAGEKILGTMFKSGPYSPGSTGQLSGRLPSGIHPPRLPRIRAMHMGKFADGGSEEQTGNGDVPIIAAGGEYVIHPDQVKEIGHGDLNAGHRVLDKFVLSVRKNHIETLKNLKPPKQ